MKYYIARAIPYGSFFRRALFASTSLYTMAMQWPLHEAAAWLQKRAMSSKVYGQQLSSLGVATAQLVKTSNLDDDFAVVKPLFAHRSCFMRAYSQDQSPAIMNATWERDYTSKTCIRCRDPKTQANSYELLGAVWRQR